jgi:hypothetical protein
VPLSDVDAQLLVVRQVGDIDPVTCDPVDPAMSGVTGLVMQSIGALWVNYADRAMIHPRLRDLHVKIAAQEIVIGRLEALVSFSGVNGGISVSLSNRVKARQEQLDKWHRELKVIESQFFGASGAAVGQISQTAPIMPPVPGETSSPNTWATDANDPSYNGSPYWRDRMRK